MKLHRAWSLAGAAAVMFGTNVAGAEDLRVHANAGGTHAVGGPQENELGWGAVGQLALELPLGRLFGVQLEGTSMWVSKRQSPADPRLADRGDGVVLGGLAGARFHPLDVGGPWLDLNAGVVQTGGLTRFAIDTHAGYAFRVGSSSSRWDVGPFVGYQQVLQPDDALRPDDAHLFLIGIHGSFGAPARPRPAFVAKPQPRRPTPRIAAATAPPPPPPVPTLPKDYDSDGAPDATDACPMIPGVRTDDPRTDGCPIPTKRVSVVRDQLVLADRIYFDFDAATVKQTSWSIVQELAEYVKAHPELETISIEGHSDEVGDATYNEQLSRARAEAVRDLLVDRFHVDAKRLQTKDWGESRPVDSGHTSEAYQKNRRVELVVTRVTVVEKGGDR